MTWQTDNEEIYGYFEISVMGTVNSYSSIITIKLLVQSALQFNPNKPYMANSSKYQGSTMNLQELSDNQIELGVPDDLDGDLVLSQLSVNPKS
jgi:hypothetical protein